MVVEGEVQTALILSEAQAMRPIHSAAFPGLINLKVQDSYPRVLNCCVVKASDQSSLQSWSLKDAASVHQVQGASVSLPGYHADRELCK